MAPISAGLFPCLHFKIFYDLEAQSLVVDVDFALAPSLSMCHPHSPPVAPAVHVVLSCCNFQMPFKSESSPLIDFDALAFDPLAAGIRFRPLLQSRVNCAHLLPLPVWSSRPCKGEADDFRVWRFCGD